MRNILLCSGNIGLGHVTRDLAIATELRAQCNDLRIAWLAAHPATEILQSAGEKLIDESKQYSDTTLFSETVAGNFSLKLLNPATIFKSAKAFKALLRHLKNQKNNVAIFKQLITKQNFDLVIADEAYELMSAFVLDPVIKHTPFVFICDRIGFDTTTANPLEWILLQIANWREMHFIKRFYQRIDLTLMIGEEDDVPDKPFGIILPNGRKEIRKTVKYAGYIIQFDPTCYQNKEWIRGKLGYGTEPLVICSIGGTSIGKALLELCGKVYPIIKAKLPNIRMLLVCGPRLDPNMLKVPKGVEKVGYIHKFYEHMAACDLAIVQGGGTTTLELTALRRPFIYFPLEGHIEQQNYVTKRLERHGAGVKLDYRKTTPESLAKMVLKNINREVDYPPIITDGAQKAVKLLRELI